MKVLTRIFVAVFVALFLTVGTCYGLSPYAVRGMEYAGEGKFEAARKEFKEALKDPLDMAAKDRLKIVEDAIAQKIQKEAAIHFFKGAAYYNNGMVHLAIANFNKAIEINPAFAEAYSNRGRAYERGGQHDRAMADYNKAIEINPRYAEAYFNRGTLYVRFKGNYDQAIADYNKTIEITPGYARVYYARAMAYYHKGEYDKAWEDVYKAQSLGLHAFPTFIEELRKASGRQK